MEKELKVSELAMLWGTSVNTVWNRIKKHNLSTVKKPNETNQEVTYVTVSEDILRLYIKNVVNKNDNIVNNGNYEEVLSHNKNNDNLNADVNEVVNNIIELNNSFNERFNKLTDELILAKSKELLLEDKANREGFYINEINELKKDNKKLNNNVNRLIMVLSIILLISVLSIVLLIMNIHNNVNSVQETVINDKKPAQVQEVIPPTPVQVKKSGYTYKKK